MNIMTEADATEFDDPEAALADAITDRIVANAEFYDAVETYLETGPKNPGVYEGLRRLVRQDTEELKRVVVADGRAIDIPEEQHPPEWEAILTTYDGSQHD